MLILAFESSARPASVALLRDGQLLSQYSQCSQLTHSRTLLPMAEDMLKNAELTLDDVDLFAVAHGPGSFTGIRIGVSTVKGLAWASDKPCVGVSTLEAMAWHGLAAGGLICPVMDARRSQVYNALFEIRDGKPARLTEDRPISLEELAAERASTGRSFWSGTGRNSRRRPSRPRGSHTPWRPRISAGRAPGAWPWPPRTRPPAAPTRCCPCTCASRRRNGSARPVWHRKASETKIQIQKENTIMSKVCVFDHPLIQHKLSILRDEKTSVKEFRELISEIAMLMCYEATRDLPTEEVDVKTPVAVAKCRRIAGKKLAVVPILRAGLGMVDGMVSMMPNVKVGHIGLFRDPETKQPVKYYFKMPADIEERDAIVVDPMLATGGSASAAITFLKEAGVKHIKLMSIIGAPEGVARMQADHPDVDIYVAALDDHLNENAYIVPGLGDAGDRIFGTK